VVTLKAPSSCDLVRCATSVTRGAIPRVSVKSLHSGVSPRGRSECARYISQRPARV